MGGHFVVEGMSESVDMSDGTEVDERQRVMTQAWASPYVERLHPDDLALFAAAGPDTDVRTLTHAENHLRLSWALLCPGIDFGLWMFHRSPDGSAWVREPGGFTIAAVGNQDLGPLADLHVYATDPTGSLAGQWRSKSHGLCQHQQTLTTRTHQLLTLAEFLPLHQQDPGHGQWNGSGWCSRCGGYAVRRLTEDQYLYYAHCRRQAQAALDRRH